MIMKYKKRNIPYGIKRKNNFSFECETSAKKYKGIAPNDEKKD